MNIKHPFNRTGASAAELAGSPTLPGGKVYLNPTKRAPEQVGVAEGFRLLTIGEQIPADAEYWSQAELQWVPTRYANSIAHERCNDTYRTRTSFPWVTSITRPFQVGDHVRHPQRGTFTIDEVDPDGKCWITSKQFFTPEEYSAWTLDRRDPANSALIKAPYRKVQPDEMLPADADAYDWEKGWVPTTRRTNDPEVLAGTQVIYRTRLPAPIQCPFKVGDSINVEGHHCSPYAVKEVNQLDGSCKVQCQHGGQLWICKDRPGCTLVPPVKMGDLEATDIPPGSVLRLPHWAKGRYVTPLSVGEHTITVSVCHSGTQSTDNISYSKLRKNLWEIAIDGKTFSKCEKEIK